MSSSSLAPKYIPTGWLASGGSHRSAARWMANRVVGGENSLVETRWRDKIIETADDGRQPKVTWEISGEIK